MRLLPVLVRVNGVGPKVALAILSCLSPGELRSCVELEAPELLTPVPGIGRRTAEKILVELRGRLDRLSPSVAGSSGGLHAGVADGNQRGRSGAVVQDRQHWERSLAPDLRSALENLGFKDKDISPVLSRLRNEVLEGEGLSALVRRALKLIASAGKPVAAPGSQEEQQGQVALNRLF